MTFEACYGLTTIYHSRFISHFSTTHKTIAELMTQPTPLSLFLGLCIRPESCPLLPYHFFAWKTPSCPGLSWQQEVSPHSPNESQVSLQCFSDLNLMIAKHDIFLFFISLDLKRWHALWSWGMVCYLFIFLGLCSHFLAPCISSKHSNKYLLNEEIPSSLGHIFIQPHSLTCALITPVLYSSPVA